jgi:hypothetical protein
MKPLANGSESMIYHFIATVKKVDKSDSVVLCYDAALRERDGKPIERRAQGIQNECGHFATKKLAFPTECRSHNRPVRIEIRIDSGLEFSCRRENK